MHLDEGAPRAAKASTVMILENKVEEHITFVYRVCVDINLGY